MSEVLGKYRLIAELGRGGMGTVYLAVVRGPARFSKLVVIKQLRVDVSDDMSFTTMFLEEARLAARLNHPNIVQTNEVVLDPRDGYFIVMEYLEGASLKTLLRRLRARPDEPTRDARVRALFIRAILEVLSALQYAHELKDFDGTPLRIVHRDVSPANVVVAHGGQVKLLDFGIAKAADSSVRTQTGILKGKIHYMSPEPLAGEPVDCRVDVFAVGAMLWDALAGQRLWEGLKDFEIAKSLLGGVVPSPRSVNPGVSPALEAICMRALACKKEDRYPDAASFRAELERACAGTLASAEDLSAAMAAEFVEEQRQMRARIAEQLHLTEEVVTTVLPSFSTRAPGDGATGMGASAAVAPEDPVVDDGSSAPTSGGGPTPSVAWRIGAAAVGACVVVGTVVLGLRSSPARPAAAAPAAQLQAPASAAPVADPTRGAATQAPIGEPPAAETADREHPSGTATSGHHGGWPFRSASAARPRPGGAAALTPEIATPDEPPGAAPERTTSPAAVATPAAVAATQASPPPEPASPAPAVPNGTIPMPAQKAVFDAHSPEIQACWERARMEQPFLSVRVAINATVAPDGHVSNVAVSATHEGTSRLQACIRSAVQTWTFPRPAGDTAGRVSRTFLFEP
jgi:eukaryotic-like serine/threonine-protein kinase